MNACMSYAEGPIFPVSAEYMEECGYYRARNYGVRLHEFATWYLEMYPEGREYGCKSFQDYVCMCIERIEGRWVHVSPEAWERILHEMFPQPYSSRREPVFLEDWLGFERVCSPPAKEVQKERLNYMQKLLKRPNRVLVCGVSWL